MKLEFVNRDCGLVATAELIGDRWYIEIEATQTLNTLAKDSEADVREWALQHGFKNRKTAAELTAEVIAKAGQNRPGLGSYTIEVPFPDDCAPFKIVYHGTTKPPRIVDAAQTQVDAERLLAKYDAEPTVPLMRGPVKFPSRAARD